MRRWGNEKERGKEMGLIILERYMVKYLGGETLRSCYLKVLDNVFQSYLESFPTYEESKIVYWKF